MEAAAWRPWPLAWGAGAPGAVAPEQLWGVFVRLYGLALCFATAMLVPQCARIWGASGLFPLRTRLRRIAADEAAPQRWLRHPSLLWLTHGHRWDHLVDGDAVLRVLLISSAVAGFLLTVVGLHSRAGLALMYAVYLSFVSGVTGVSFPWDRLLMESSVLCLFLPRLSSVSSLSLSAAPSPLLSFSLRFLVFRLLFGFGKFKFGIGTRDASRGNSRREFSYLQGFLVQQPLPTVLGWVAAHLPLAFHQAGLLCFFLSEIIVPFFYFVSGWWRQAAGAITVMLMGGIQATGSFGFFNVLTAVLCLPLFDGRDTLFGSESLGQQFFSHGVAHFLAQSALAFLLPWSLLHFPFNSWCAETWFLWPSLAMLSRSPAHETLFRCIRALDSFKLTAAYGVFFQYSSPPLRWVPVLEGTDDERVNDLHERRMKEGKGEAGYASSGDGDADGVRWRQFEFKYMTTRCTRPPPCCAPWHDRLDQALIYEGMGMTPESLLASLIFGGRFNLDTRPATTLLSRCAALLLQDRRDIGAMFRQPLPFPIGAGAPARPLQAVRLSLYCYTAASWAEWLRSGCRLWWHRRYVGAHAPLLTRRMVARSLALGADAIDSSGELHLEEPEAAHPDLYLPASDTLAMQALHSRLAAAVAALPGKGADSAARLDLVRLIATGSLEDGMAQDLVTRVTPSHVRSELFGPQGFVAKLQPLLRALVPPPVSAEALAADPDAAYVPRHDFDHYLAPGEFSRLATRTMLGEGSPVGGLDGPARRRLRKMWWRATHLALRALLPVYHPPGPEHDEVITVSELLSAQAQGASFKRGRYCLHPCVRDGCEHRREHLHLPSFFHLWLFAQHCVCQGPLVLARVLVDPVHHAPPLVASFSLAVGLAPLSQLAPATLAFHAGKTRLTNTISFPHQLQCGGMLPGFLSPLLLFLPREYRTPDEGAFSPVGTGPALLPATTPPRGWTEGWKVCLSKMPHVNAPGLVGQDVDEDAEILRRAVGEAERGQGVHRD